MKSLSRLLLVAVALAAPLALSAKITRTVEKTFAVQPGGTLKAKTQGGDIKIETSEKPEVHVLVKQLIRANSDAEADEILSKLELTFDHSGNDVTVESKYEKQGFGKWFGSWPPVQVSFVITVPKQYHLNLNTSGGDIAVASLTGNVRAHTSGGDLDLARIAGEVDAGTSGGDIKLVEGTARAKLSTSGGNITVDRAGGPTDVSTSGGDITLNSVAQLVRASTSGGDIHAVITEPIQRDTELDTSGGDVQVKIGKDSAFQLDAGTSGGEVRATGITIKLEAGGVGKHKLVGAVNGGGPRLKLRTSGGDVTVTAE